MGLLAQVARELPELERALLLLELPERVPLAGPEPQVLVPKQAEPELQGPPELALAHPVLPLAAELAFADRPESLVVSAELAPAR